MCLGFALNELKFDRNIQAALVEVRSRFVIAVALVHVSHALVGFETVANSLLALSVVQLAFFEAFTDRS